MKVYVVINAKFYRATGMVDVYLRGVFSTWKQAAEQVNKEFDDAVKHYKNFEDAVIDRSSWYLFSGDDDWSEEERWDIQGMELDVAETEYIPVLSI